MSNEEITKIADDEFLTIRETAELLKMHPNTIYKYGKSNKIPSGVKVGQKWLFSKNKIMDFMNKQMG